MDHSKQKISWPPDHLHKKDLYAEDGEGMWVSLNRFQYDRTLRGKYWLGCCDCGLIHLFTFEVVKEKGNAWWIVMRAYREGILFKERDKRKRKAKK